VRKIGRFTVRVDSHNGRELANSLRGTAVEAGVILLQSGHYRPFFPSVHMGESLRLLALNFNERKERFCENMQKKTGYRPLVSHSSLYYPLFGQTTEGRRHKIPRTVENAKPGCIRRKQTTGMVRNTMSLDH